MLGAILVRSLCEEVPKGAKGTAGVHDPGLLGCMGEGGRLHSPEAYPCKLDMKS